jgi:hypothetical protein
LLIGLAGAACLAQGRFGWVNAGAFLIMLSNFVDHTDGELARISGKSSKIGHFDDLASDAVITVLLFVCMGAGLAAQRLSPWAFSASGKTPRGASPKSSPAMPRATARTSRMRKQCAICCSKAVMRSMSRT